MAKDPDERYTTTMELANAAHAAVTDPAPRRETPVETQPKSMPADADEAPTQPAPNADRAAPHKHPRNPPAFTSAPTQKRSPMPPRVPDTPSGSGTRRKVGLWLAGAAVVVAVIIGTVVAFTQSGHKSATGQHRVRPSILRIRMGLRRILTVRPKLRPIRATEPSTPPRWVAAWRRTRTAPATTSRLARIPWIRLARMRKLFYRVVRRTQNITECSADQLAVQADDTKVIICLEPWFGQSRYGR